MIRFILCVIVVVGFLILSIPILLVEWIGAYSSLSRMVEAGKVKLFTRYEMEDIVIVDGHARGIIAKNLITGPALPMTATAASSRCTLMLSWSWARASSRSASTL